LSLLELDIPNLPADIKISTYDVILSAIDIETTKIVRSKIYNLVTSSKEEMNFVRSLKAKLEESKTSLIFAGSAFEVLALYSDMDINKIPNVALKTIKPKQISQMTLQNTMNNALAIYTKKTLDALVATTYYNNPKDIFNYLTLITRMDVLISYMDQKMIDAVYTYCDNNNPNNNKNIENVKRLIREKNKRKTEE